MLVNRGVKEGGGFVPETDKFTRFPAQNQGLRGRERLIQLSLYLGQAQKKDQEVRPPEKGGRERVFGL